METSDDKLERRLYSHDLAPLPKEMDVLFKTMPDQVVRPNYTEDVVQMVKKANATGKPIVPRGAGTWGLGGSVPVKGGTVLDMTSMNKIISHRREEPRRHRPAGHHLEGPRGRTGRSGILPHMLPQQRPLRHARRMDRYRRHGHRRVQVRHGRRLDQGHGGRAAHGRCDPHG